MSKKFVVRVVNRHKPALALLNDTLRPSQPNSVLIVRFTELLYGISQNFQLQTQKIIELSTEMFLLSKFIHMHIHWTRFVFTPPLHHNNGDSQNRNLFDLFSLFQELLHFVPSTVFEQVLLELNDYFSPGNTVLSQFGRRFDPISFEVDPSALKPDPNRSYAKPDQVFTYYLPKVSVRTQIQLTSHLVLFAFETEPNSIPFSLQCSLLYSFLLCGNFSGKVLQFYVKSWSAFGALTHMTSSHLTVLTHDRSHSSPCHFSSQLI